MSERNHIRVNHVVLQLVLRTRFPSCRAVLIPSFSWATRGRFWGDATAVGADVFVEEISLVGIDEEEIEDTKNPLSMYLLARKSSVVANGSVSTYIVFLVRLSSLHSIFTQI